MLVVNHLDRAFYYEQEGTAIRLADPNPSMNEYEVLNFYSLTYPELVSAKIEAPRIEADEVRFEFTTVIGTKG